MYHIFQHLILLQLYVNEICCFQVVDSFLLFFQTRDLDYTFVRPLVSGVISQLNAMKETPGEHFQALPALMETLVDMPYQFRHPTDTAVKKFRAEVNTTNTVNQL